MSDRNGASKTKWDEDPKWEREQRRRLDKEDRDKRYWDWDDDDDELRQSRKHHRRKKRDWEE